MLRKGLRASWKSQSKNLPRAKIREALVGFLLIIFCIDPSFLRSSQFGIRIIKYKIDHRHLTQPAKGNNLLN